VSRAPLLLFLAILILILILPTVMANYQGILNVSTKNGNFQESICMQM